MICTSGNPPPNPAARPFRFEAAWISYDSFAALVEDFWDHRDGHVTDSLSIFTDVLKNWNHTVFGNIFRRKRQLMARLKGIQTALCKSVNYFLLDLKKDLLQEYNDILKQEEVFWFQKSRERWVKLGDRNTQYFHTSTLFRRKRNKIEALKDDSSAWCYEIDVLKEMAVSFYKLLYDDFDQVANAEYPKLTCSFPSLLADDLRRFSLPIHDNAIKNAVHSIGAFKAPEPNGFQAIFFQKCWSKAKVLQGKYFHDKQFLTADVKPYNSFTWKSIMKGCEVLKQGIKWRLGNGEDIEFWNDIWLDNFILRELAINLVPVEHLQWKVSEYIFDGKWKLNILRGLLPDHILASLEAIDLQVCCSWKDKVIWKLSSDGKFSTSSARSLLRGTPPSVDLSIFKKIWRIQTLPRIKFFVWLAYLNKLLTNDLRWKRKMVDLPSCSLCSSLVEDVLHAIRDCSHVSQIWQKMVPSFMQSSFFSANLNDWFILNLNCGVLFRDTIPWPTVFSFLAWRFWKWRNKLLFVDNFSIPLNALFSLCAEVEALWSTLEHSPPKLRVEMNVKWFPPSTGYVKLNSDGCSKNGGLLAGYGRVIRCDCGQWLGGYVVNLGYGTNMFAEISGIYYGLKLAWELGFRKVEAELDSMVVLKLIQEDDVEFHPYANLILSCKELMKLDWQVFLSHIYRETNSSADCLANLSVSWPIGVHTLDSAPVAIESFLKQDLMGVGRRRPNLET
ncbi:Ribonuclease H [Quillaja saponaria]|uniref:Ribonuclease H n=1 Tax=Quillaja saponaria TaxID=32244 RepID=A0AAD7VPA8_QUISA|nr:Ribonuclease H [Quillaja saponaria]